MSQTRHEIQTLYRGYLRLVRDWPADKVRPNRDMKQILAKRVEETFRESQSEKLDMDAAKLQLDALERLLDNEFKLKYPLSDSILTPAGNPKYYSSLITSLGAAKDNRKGMFARLFGK